MLSLNFIHEKKTIEKISKINSRSFYLLIAGIIAISLVQTSYAQLELEEQVTISDNILNDPIAQDILKKIEQTRKAIADLEQKEFEENQAQENLQKMRDLSVERLNQDLKEWERLWEKHSSRNAFDSFVSKKPSYVQGVFWDQFEFKEKKVNAGRVAMIQVLNNGGTMEEAKEAYNQAAATRKIELIEMNAQFNIKHNLADVRIQQIFNSTGQYHISPASDAKLAGFYSNYKEHPSYMLANSIHNNSADMSAETKCGEGLTLVSRVTSGTFSCVDEDIARKWVDDRVKGIVIVGESMPTSKVVTNPGTECNDGHRVIYNIAESEYQCVSESNAKDMIENKTAENHTLIDYILGKDKTKIYEDKIYEINQEVKRIFAEYDLKKKGVETKYKEDIDDANKFAKEEMQMIIGEYEKSDGTGNFTKEYITKIISDIRDSNEENKERIFEEKIKTLEKLEEELKRTLLKVTKGYERNSDINVDWDYLLGPVEPIVKENERENDKITKVSLTGKDKMYLHNVDVINSFGQKFDEVKQNQILQIAGDITNPDDSQKDFVYTVDITDDNNNKVQPTKWITGSLDPDQTLNVSLSWIPEELGEFNAKVSLGNDMDSILETFDLRIEVSPEADIHNVDYCKNGYELLFKYSDNSPICASTDTASKLINIGLAFN